MVGKMSQDEKKQRSDKERWAHALPFSVLRAIRWSREFSRGNPQFILRRSPAGFFPPPARATRQNFLIPLGLEKAAQPPAINLNRNPGDKGSLGGYEKRYQRRHILRLPDPLERRFLLEVGH